MTRRVLAPPVLGILLSVVGLAICPAWAAEPAPPAPVEAQPLERYLPASTSFMMAIRDMPGLRERWKTSGFGQLLADPVVKSYVGMFLDEAEIKEMDDKIRAKVGKSLEEVLALFPGQIVFGLTDLDSLLKIEEEGADKGPFVLLADVQGHGKDVTEVLERLDENEPDDESTDTGTVTRVMIISVKRF